MFLVYLMVTFLPFLRQQLRKSIPPKLSFVLIEPALLEDIYFLHYFQYMVLVRLVGALQANNHLLKAGR